MPVNEPTVPTATLLLLHVPAIVASVSVVVDPGHTVYVPKIAVGADVTVTTIVAAGAQPVEYVIVAVPNVAPPVTTPVSAPTVAVGGVLELQLPPAVASVRFVVKPEHISVVPVIGPGIPVTVIVFVE